MPPYNTDVEHPRVQARAVLLIEDDVPIRRLLGRALADVTERVIEAETGATGIAVASVECPDLVVLDLGLPDMAGRQVCREIRRGSDAPIVVVSAHHGEWEKVSVLDAGADDYVTKPFSTTEFVARARAHLRRSLAGSAPPEPVLHVGDLAIDIARRTAARAGGAVHLTPLEWRILCALLVHAGRTLTHRQLCAAGWDREGGDQRQCLRVCITGLRRKIEADPTRPEIIVTEPGVGYRGELQRSAIGIAGRHADA